MQFNKVEISGVDTNSLKVLTEQEKLDLLEKTRKGDKKAREETEICVLCSAFCKGLPAGAIVPTIFFRWVLWGLSRQ